MIQHPKKVMKCTARSVFDPAAQAAKLRESGKLNDLQNDPELKPVFEELLKIERGSRYLFVSEVYLG